jgi:hypothetical protein
MKPGLYTLLLQIGKLTRLCSGLPTGIVSPLATYYYYLVAARYRLQKGE